MPSLTTVDVVNPTTHVTIGTLPATYWVDPISGVVYTVPIGYNPQNTINQFTLSSASAQSMAQIYSTDGASPTDAMLGTALTEISNLYSGYKAGGPNDLQRTAPDGTSYGGFVPAFTPIASFDLGLGTAASGLPTLV